jgi:hypothetical protein
VSDLKQTTDQEKLIVRYFCAETSDEEDNQVEIRLLTDDQFFDEMQSVESALIDSYVQGRLTDSDRSTVEQRLLNSPRQLSESAFVRGLISDLEVSKAGFAEVDERPTSKRHGLPSLPRAEILRKKSLVALLLVASFALALVGWNLVLQIRVSRLWTQRANIEREKGELQARLDAITAHEQSTQVAPHEPDVGETPAPPTSPSNPTTPTSHIAVISLDATSFVRGGGELAEVHIEQAIDRLQIRIAVGGAESPAAYSAILRTFEGRNIWSGTGRGSGSGKVVFTIPVRLLANDDYTLTLERLVQDRPPQDVGDYSFRVKK